MSYDIYKIKGSELIDEKVRNKITDIKNVAKTGSYKDLDLTGATINNNYTLPNSSDNTLGGIKIGEGLKIDSYGRLGQAHTIDLSLHKTSIQLTKDRHQIIDVIDGDTIILPTIDNEELLIIDVKIEIPWNSEHKSPTVTFPTNIKWVEKPRLKFDSWYDYSFIYVKGEWLGSFVEYDTVYDSSMNMFVFDTSKTAEDKTVTLDSDRRGDTTNWDRVTDWGDGTFDKNRSHTYNNDGIYVVKTKWGTHSDRTPKNTKNKMIDILSINKNMTNMDFMFKECNLSKLNTAKWNLSNITSMNRCFGNTSILSLDCSGWDTSKVTNMHAMFASSSIKEIDTSGWDTSKVTSMNSMFYNTKLTEIKGIEKWDISNLKDAGELFRDSYGLTTLDVSNWNTSNVTNMNWMFSGCNSLATLDVSNFNTTKVTNMNNMFSYCSSLTALDVSNFNTNNVTDMSLMFSGCNNLAILDVSNFNTSNVTNMSNMFGWCNILAALDLSNFNTSNVTNMSNMFYSCKNITTLDISNFNMDNVTTYENMFTNCTSLHQSGLTMTNCNEATKTKINSMVQV